MITAVLPYVHLPCPAHRFCSLDLCANVCSTSLATSVCILRYEIMVERVLKAVHCSVGYYGIL